MMFFASQIWCCSRWSQWCDVCHKMWRSHASLGEAVIMEIVRIICRRQTSFKKRTFVGRQKCFFVVTPLQNRSAEQVFSKSIRVFLSVDRLIPWWWGELHLTAVFRGATPCLQTNLCIIVLWSVCWKNRLFQGNWWLWKDICYCHF